VRRFSLAVTWRLRPCPLLAVYPRCAGRSTVRGCDVHALDVRTGVEEPVAGLASPAVSETAPGASGCASASARARRPAAAPGTYGIDPRGRTVARALTPEGLVRLDPRPRFE